MELKKSDHRLFVVTKVIVALWLLAQIVVMVWRHGTPIYSDSANYVAFATEAYEEGSWYPIHQQMAGNAWIANTGYINFIVANLYIFGSLKFIAIEQLLFNCLLLFSFWRLSSRLGDRRTGAWAAIVFCLLPSNVLCVTPIMSDLLCVALFMASMLMMRCDGRWLFAAGVCAALANWVRPVGMIYWPSVLLMCWLASGRSLGLKRFAGYAVIYLAGLLVVNGGIMALTYRSCGVALAGSTTKGTNMIMGCNDLANGAYNDDVFKPGNIGYIEPGSMDAKERDAELTSRSVRWILSHPVRFMKLIPAKIFRLWCGDYYNDKLYQPGNVKTPMSTIILWSVTYYLTLLLALVGIWRVRRRLWGEAGVILLPVLLGTAMHLLMYGGMRYHYPMMPPLIFFAAVALSGLRRIGMPGEEKKIDVKNADRC